MDPFSITAGVAGLITLIAQTAKLASSYSHGVAGASKQAATMFEALSQLERIVISLNDRLNKKSTGGSAFTRGKGSLLFDTLQSCHQRIDTLLQRISRAAAGGRLKALKWPLNKKDHEEALRDIRMFCQWIQLSLTIESNDLLSDNLESINALSHATTESAGTLQDVHGTCDRL